MSTRDETLGRLRATLDHPATARELIQRLAIPKEHRTAFRRHLKALAATGSLVEVRGHRYALPGRADRVVGRLRTSPGGFGFVTPEAEDAGPGDIYVPPSGLAEALHGDRVVIEAGRARGGLRPEGRIVKVLERASALIVGRYASDARGIGRATPIDDRLLVDVGIAAGHAGGAQPGDMVTVEVLRWPTATRGPTGRVVEVLGRIDDLGVDTKIVIRKYQLPDEHGSSACEEAWRLTAGHADPTRLDAAARDVAGRTDFRGTTVVTIDGEHARDFDDAISLERLPNGHYWLGVHIADVSHYVPDGSALDEEAYDRGTSVYFPERALHMFPDALATGLCSLNPHVDRLVQSCLMEVDASGVVVRREFHDGVVNCRARMTYTDVNRILTDRDAEAIARHVPLVPLFEQMAELFGVLNARRQRLGSIDFDLEEPEITLDDEGMVRAITAAERNLAHRIVEEFMLLANETVAAFLEAGGGPGLYRVHEPPDPLKVQRFEDFVTGLGYSLAAPPDGARPADFQRLVLRLRGQPEEKPVALLMLRTMQKARYAPVNLGHFGLAFSHYTHFTSPIRRYPDLVVHRLLRAARRGGASGAARDELEEVLPEIARHTSETERRAQEAERELVQWKKVRFMADKVGDEFDGYITGVAPFGLFVELIEHFVEGLVHISTMADDVYRFDQATYTLRGETTQTVYRLGDRVRVQVVRVDTGRRQIDLGIAVILDRLRHEEALRGPRRRRAKPKQTPRRRTSGARPNATRRGRRR
jgi:ribonuclease R